MKKLILITLLVLAHALSAVAQTSPIDEKIVLKKQFLSGYKYQLGSQIPKPVCGFAGLSLKPDFENTLAAHPPALAEARQAILFNGVNQLCWVGIAAITLSDLLGTVGQARNPGSGSTSISLGPIIGLSAGAIVSGLIGKSKIESGVRMYNESGRTLPSAPSLPQSTAVSTTGSSVFGFKAGLNMASQSLSLSKGVTRLDLGGFVTIPVSQSVTLQPEALYSMKGSKIQTSGTSFTYKLDYLDFPLLVKYAFPTSVSARPFVFAGPSLGILISAKGVYKYGGDDMKGSIKPLYKSADLGLVFGGGLNLSRSMSVDARYVMGLSNIASSLWEEAGAPPGFSIKNSAVSLMVGCSL